ncbi:MAG: hypothetical protein QW103_00480 [Candidatus Pacearchaeota archaeon]
MAKEKTFFRRPTEREILRDENLVKVYRHGGLIKILESSEGPFLLHFSLIPNDFYRNTNNSYEAAKEYSKRGELIKVKHPQTLSDCAFYQQPFYNFFIESLRQSFKKTKLPDNKFIGYYFQPQWVDRQRREVFFKDLLGGFLSYLYFRKASPIEVDDRYVGNQKRANQGTQVVVSVPSKRKKQKRYRFKLINVPFHKRANNLGISLMLRSSTGNLEESLRPAAELYYIQYKPREWTLEPTAIRFLPQDIAAYYAISEKQKKEGNNITEFFSPFPFPSKDLLEFYLKLWKKTIVFEPRDKLNKENENIKNYRFLYEPEISRAISLFLHRKERDLNNLFLREFKEEDYSFLEDEIQKSLEG